jgi:hypothetical protein
MYGTRVGVQRVIACPPVVAPVTVTAALAVRRESAVDVAVIVAVPAATPRTVTCAPFAVTDAIAAFDVDQVTSVALPPNAVTVAASVVVAPTATDAVVGVTATLATPETMIDVLALFDASACDVAVIVAVPGATPVMAALFPFAVTTTFPVFDDAQVTACDAPFVTATVAVNVAAPFTTIDDGAPEIETDVTVGVLLLFPPLQFGALTGHFSPPPPPHETWTTNIASRDVQRARDENDDANWRGIYL